MQSFLGGGGGGMKPLANPLGDLENMVKNQGKQVDDKLTGHTTEIEDLKARVKALEEKNAGATAEVKGGNDVVGTEQRGQPDSTTRQISRQELLG